MMGDEFVAAIIAGMVGTIIAVGIQSTMDDKKGKVKRNKVIRVKTDFVLILKILKNIKVY